MSYFGFDLLLHVGLGFGLNEVYIMAAHWIFAIPIAMSYLFARLNGRALPYLRITVGLLTLFLWIWNLSLIVKYLVFS